MGRHGNPLKLDPTRTTLLRAQAVREVNRRFGALKKAVTELIVEDDVFGLKPRKGFTTLGEEFVRAWEFRTDKDKLTSFNRWFQGQIDDNILSIEGVDGEPWTSKYVDSAYRKGAVRAYTDVKRDTGATSLDFYNGSKKQFLESAFAQPERVSKLKFLFTRTFEELKGVSAAMSQQMSRVLASGIANGLGPEEVARQLNNTITGITRQRARVLARTEIIAAHSEGQLDSFEDLGIEEVGIMAEWSTAGDGRVCPLCVPLEGTVMTIKEARGLLPRHPNCRCAWIPANVGEQLAGQKLSKPAKEVALADSIHAERPNVGIAEALRRSRWLGKTKRLSGTTKAQRAQGRLLREADTKLIIPPKSVPGVPREPPEIVKPTKPKVIPKPSKSKPEVKVKAPSEWSPEMSAGEADAWAAEGVYPENFFHGTNSASKARSTGFLKSADDANDFAGISFSQDVDYAQGYGSELLRVKVRLKKGDVFEIDDAFYAGTRTDDIATEIYEIILEEQGLDVGTDAGIAWLKKATIGQINEAMDELGFKGWVTRNSSGKIMELRIWDKKLATVVKEGR